MAEPQAAHLAPRLTPRGHLLAVAEADAAPLADDVVDALAEAFAGGSGKGLLYLATALPGRARPPAWAWWRDFATRHVVAACGHEGEAAAPAALELATRIADAPPMTGAGYLDADVLMTLWREVGAALGAELAGGRTLENFLRSRHAAWHVVGRVHFNLAENRKDPAAPFAFLATYVSGLSAHGKAQHLPLIAAGEIYHPMLCKHVAAVLYGVGNRLDSQPELLFALRGVDAADLIGEAAGADLSAPQVGADKRLDDDMLADMFGIELAAPAPAATKKRNTATSKRGTKEAKKPAIEQATRQNKSAPARKPKTSVKPQASPRKASKVSPGTKAAKSTSKPPAKTSPARKPRKA